MGDRDFGLSVGHVDTGLYVQNGFPGGEVFDPHIRPIDFSSQSFKEGLFGSKTCGEMLVLIGFARAVRDFSLGEYSCYKSGVFLVVSFNSLVLYYIDNDTDVPCRLVFVVYCFCLTDCFSIVILCLVLCMVLRNKEKYKLYSSSV